MFDPDRSGGGGGGDPWTNHPLVKAIRAEVDRHNALCGVMQKHLRHYTFMTIVNTVVFGSSVAFFIALALHNWGQP